MEQGATREGKRRQMKREKDSVELIAKFSVCSILLLAFYWVSNFLVADLIAKDLRQQDEDLSSEEKRGDSRF